MDTTAPKPRIFICYNSEDADFVAWLSRSLRGLGHAVWDDQENIVGGLSTIQALQSALDQSDVMLLVITPEALQSRLVNSQWTYFFGERGKALIPLLRRTLGPSDKLNFMLASLQSIDFSSDYDPSDKSEAALARLHHTLQQTYSWLTRGGDDDVPSSYHTPRIKEDDFGTRQAGLLRVHQAMPIDTFVGWTQHAHKTVRLLTTWTGLLYNQPQLFYAPLERGCAVQILLLNPSSPFARQRSLDIYLGMPLRTINEQEVPRNIQTSIRQIADLYQEAEGLPGRLDLRLYDLLPSFSLYQCDLRILIGFFPHSARTTTFPMLEVQSDSLLGRRFSEEFDAIWTHATAIDLSPRVPPRRADSAALDEALSARELEILKLIDAGLSNQDIAEVLVVTLATVKKHINNLYGKLGVNTRTQAILRAHQLNLISHNTPPSPLMNSP
jgi:DNA-binding CsgD family transcriptional regulator